MRSLGPTSRRSVPGRGWPGAWLPVVVGAFLTFGLALWGGSLAEPEPSSPLAGAAVPGAEPGRAGSGPRVLTGCPARQPSCARFHGVGFDTWAAAHAPSHLSARPGWCAARGRGGASPDGLAVPRWSRARWGAPDTALARRARHPVAAVSPGGGRADQPPIVTRPSRGPPARG